MSISKTRITTDLKNPKLLRLLKLEAQETHSSANDVVIRALETYFHHSLETKVLLRAAESTFEEWNDPRDAIYDKI